jgi:hypothetical protein
MAVVAEPLEQRAGLLASLTLLAAPLTLAFRERLPGSHPALGVSKAVPRAVRQERQDSEDLDLTGDPLGAGFDPEQEWDLSLHCEEEGRSTAA